MQSWLLIYTQAPPPVVVLGPTSKKAIILNIWDYSGMIHWILMQATLEPWRCSPPLGTYSIPSELFHAKQSHPFNAKRRSWDSAVRKIHSRFEFQLMKNLRSWGNYFVSMNSWRTSWPCFNLAHSLVRNWILDSLFPDEWHSNCATTSNFQPKRIRPKSIHPDWCLSFLIQ